MEENNSNTETKMNGQNAKNDHNCKDHAIAAMEDSRTVPIVWIGRMSIGAQRLIWAEMSRRLESAGSCPAVIRAAGRHLVSMFDGDQTVAMRHIILAVIAVCGVPTASDAIWEALRTH